MTTTTTRPAQLTTAEKAAQLFHIGYRCELAGRCLIVTTPHERRYRVDPIRHTCSCPATIADCAHLLGWHLLAISCANEMCWQACDIETSVKPICIGGCWRLTDAGMEARRESLRLTDAARALRFYADAQRESHNAR